MRTTARPVQPQKKKRPSSLRMLITFTMTTSMVATGGFGAFPDNPITQSFQEVISENIPADFLDPFNSYMENISAPTIQPNPVSDSENDSPFDPFGLLVDMITGDATQEVSDLPAEAAIVETALASIMETQTQFATMTSLPSPTLASTQTSIPTLTAIPIPSPTISPIPTWTFAPVVIPPTSTKQPPPPPTDTLTPFIGFNVSAVSLNGAGVSAIVAPGAPVNITYNFNIWDDPCPGCFTQLVTGLGRAGTHGGTCAFDGDAGLSPGTPGVENVYLTAPLTPGTYNVEARYYWEIDCASALANYPAGATQSSQVIGQIIVPPPPTSLVLYEGGLSDGFVRSGSGVDSICAANLPPGRNFYRAFLSISSADYLSIMPTIFSFPANVPVLSPNSTLIANDWTDLMD